MAVGDDLSCRPDRADEAAASDDVVETGFKQLEKDIAGISLPATRFGDVSPELLLHDAVVVAEFLFLRQADSIILRSPTAIAMLPRRIELSPCSVLRDIRDGYTHAAGQFHLGTEIPGHGGPPKRQGRPSTRERAERGI